MQWANGRSSRSKSKKNLRCFVGKGLGALLLLSGASTMLSAQEMAAHAGHEGQPHDHDRADSHAPIGVMGEHIHGKGEVMLSYRYMGMAMDGLVDGAQDVSTAQAFSRPYMMAPETMDMQMHMLGFMYAPSNKVTLMAMVPYLQSDMEMTMRGMMGQPNTTRKTKSEGLGDISVSALVAMPLLGKGESSSKQKWHLNIGLSLPSGNTNEANKQNARLPYSMQLGSGTYDVNLGATYNYQASNWSAGAQLMSTLRTQTKKQGYRLGNALQASAWVQKPLNANVSFSTRIKQTQTGKIRGQDKSIMLSPAMNPMMSMSPAVQTENYGGALTELAIGFNAVANTGALKGHRLGVEYIAPLHQQANGLQMKVKNTLVVGWQKAY